MDKLTVEGGNINNISVSNSLTSVGQRPTAVVSKLKMMEIAYQNTER